MPECSDRQKQVLQRVREEDEIELRDAENVRMFTVNYLLSYKGYKEGDIQTCQTFTVSVGDIEDTTSADIILSAKGSPVVAIVCAIASIESRERHVLALARTVFEHMIPYCAVTNGERTLVVETSTGKRISEAIDAIPSKDEALKDPAVMSPKKYPEDRREKETRILLAFEAMLCPTAPPAPSASGESPKENK